MTELERFDLGQSIGWVYFVQCGPSGSIKIGWAKDPNKRIASLQTAQPSKLKLLGVVPGSKQAEREAHGKFAHGHLRGEWFKRSAVITDIIALILDRGFLGCEVAKSRNSPGQKRAKEFCIRIPEA